jgi:hypothetical protein
MKKPIGERVEQVLREATEEFWRIVAYEFPEIRTGDFSPEDTFAQDEANRNAIRAWLRTNSDKFTPLAEAGFTEFQTLAVSVLRKVLPEKWTLLVTNAEDQARLPVEGRSFCLSLFHGELLPRGQDVFFPAGMAIEALTEKAAEWEKTLARLGELKGTRVVVSSEIDLYPHFTVPVGAKGVVSRADVGGISVRFDEKIAGCEEWDNEVHFHHMVGSLVDTVSPGEDPMGFAERLVFQFDSYCRVKI